MRLRSLRSKPVSGETANRPLLPYGICHNILTFRVYIGQAEPTQPTNEFPIRQHAQSSGNTEVIRLGFLPNRPFAAVNGSCPDGQACLGCLESILQLNDTFEHQKISGEESLMKAKPISFKSTIWLLQAFIAVLLVFTFVPLGSGWAASEDGSEPAAEEPAEEGSDSQADDDITEPGEQPESDLVDQSDVLDAPETFGLPEEEPDEQASASGSIGGLLWYSDDVEASTGAHRFGEGDDREPLADFTVYIYLPDDLVTPFDSAQTAADGSFAFENLETNVYVLGLYTTTIDGVEYEVLPPEESADADTMFEVKPNAGLDVAYTEPLAVRPNQTVAVTGGLIRHVRTLGDFTFTAEINLSFMHDNTSGTGYTYSEYLYGYDDYDSRFLYITDSASYNGIGSLFFNSAATGRVYHLIQTGIYTGPNDGPSPYPNDLRYGTAVVKNIFIADNVNITLVVSDIDIQGCIVLGSGSSLTLVLDNSLANAPANQIRQCITVNSGSSLTVESISGSDADGRLTIDSTTLSEPFRNGNASSARIGGIGGMSAGNITINSGTVRIRTPYGYDLYSTGAGIGGGGVTTGYNHDAGNGGNIIINGGNIEIVASTTGAGIGGGGAFSSDFCQYDAGDGGNITIAGGTVTISQQGRFCIYFDGGYDIGGAYPIAGAGIGAGGGISGAAYSGNGGDGGNIHITGGTINVTSNTRAAGIGAGTYGSVGTIVIDGGTVNAFADIGFGGSKEMGAAIGGPNGTGYSKMQQGTIIINGGTVNANSINTGIGLVHPIVTCTISITGGNVFARGTNGPGIGFWAAAAAGDSISITGGNVIAWSTNSSGIGGTQENYLPAFHLDSTANVRAYSKGAFKAFSRYAHPYLAQSKPAIWTQDNTGNGYYVNASFFPSPSPSSDMKLYVFAESSGMFLKELTLPADWWHFAYSSDQTTPRTDIILAGNGATLTNVVRTIDNQPQIYSIIAKSGYDAHMGTRGALPVKLGNGTYCLITEKSVDTDGNAIPGVADTTTWIQFNYPYSKAVPSLSPDYSTRGFSVDTLPGGVGTFTEAGTAFIPSVTESHTVYFVYGMPAAEFVFYKVNSADVPLQGARFALYTCSNGDSGHTHSNLAGVYGCCWGSPVKTAVSDADGRVEFADLDSGSYMLVETEAPAGYQLPFGQWYLETDGSAEPVIEARSSDGISLPPAFRTGTGAFSGQLLLTNYPTWDMPVAGGFGTVAMPIAGVTLLCCAGVLAMTTRKPEQRAARART